MILNDLKNFYETKYEEEVNLNFLEIIPLQKFPTNRFEACIKYFSEKFKGGKILELASGNGQMANTLLKNNKNITHFLATDLSDHRLQAIKNNISDPRLEVKNMNVEEFNAEEIEKFDAIIMVALIEHLIDPLNTMKKILTLLKPGGMIYIDTPNIADYGCRFKLLKGKFPSTASKNEGLITYDNKKVSLFDEGHLHYFTYNSLATMLTQHCGFSKTEKYYYPVGKLYFGKAFHYKLAKWKPELFSPLALVAYKN